MFFGIKEKKLEEILLPETGWCNTAGNSKR